MRVVGVVFILAAASACPKLPAPSTCAAATQLGGDRAPGATASGIERCDRSTWNRIDNGACATEAQPPSCSHARGPGDACGSDDDCGGGVSHCVDTPTETCACVVVCATAANCAAGEECVCSAAVGEDGMIGASVCAPATCSIGEDCVSGHCGVQLDECGAVIGLRCRDDDADSCSSEAACGAQPCRSGSADAPWTCDSFASCE